MTFFCPECGHEFVDGRDFLRITYPQKDNYIDNLKDLAAFFTGNRSWDFYRQSWSEISKQIDESFLATSPYGGMDGDSEEYAEYKDARAAYFKLPEVKLIQGVNFCLREDSAYDLLKQRLVEQLGYGDNEPFSLDDEFTRIKDMITEYEGVAAAKQALSGFKASSPTVARILLNAIEGSYRILHIKACSISDWFPECKQYETKEKSVFHD